MFSAHRLAVQSVERPPFHEEALRTVEVTQLLACPGSRSCALSVDPTVKVAVDQGEGGSKQATGTVVALLGCTPLLVSPGPPCLP